MGKRKHWLGENSSPETCLVQFQSSKDKKVFTVPLWKSAQRLDNATFSPPSEIVSLENFCLGWESDTERPARFFLKLGNKKVVVELT